MDMVESLELSICITIGTITFLSYVDALCTIYPGDVLELAKLTLV
jgi:hypothetical protein